MTTTTERTLVRYTTTDGIAVIELTNPPANTYSYEMMRQLDEAILRARFDDDVHVIVMRGEGDKFFCAGAEISMLNAVTLGFKYYFCLHANEPLNYWEKVIEYARGFCPPNRASKTVGRIKRAVQSGSEVALSEALAIERELQQLCFQSEDAKEGIAAYTEKRKGNFAGR